MAKIKKTEGVNSNADNDNILSNSINPDGDNAEGNNVLETTEETPSDSESSSNKESNMAQKTDEQIAKEINALQPKPKYQEYFDRQKAAADKGETVKGKVITLGDSGKSVPYEEIMQNKAYCIKKYNLLFMFELSEEQRSLIASKNLYWFAQNRF